MNASTRRWFYLVSGLAAAIVPILIQTGVIETGTGENSLALISTIGSLLGATGAGLAAHQTNKQIKEGVHDPPLSPIDQIQEAAKKVLGDYETSSANVDKLRQVSGDFLTAATGSIPVIGPIAEPITAGVNSLAQQALDSILQAPAPPQQ